MIAEQPGIIEDDDDEGALELEDLGEAEKRGIFERYPTILSLGTWARIAL